MTRAQIRKRYGIEQLEHPAIANKELSKKRQKLTKNFVR